MTALSSEPAWPVPWAARELAERGGKRVLVLERRNHVGGNAYDCFDEAGVLIHQYGPHIFHTNSTRVFDYLSRFTRWRPYEHQVVANLPDGDGRLEYPVPFNLVSLRAAFPPEKARALAEKLVSAYGMEKKVTILELRQNPDPELSALADYVYGHVFVRYTMKQWGQTPEEIDPNTTARVRSFCRRTAATFRTPTRACLWRATPPCSSPCWTTRTSRWSWGWTRPAA